MLFSDPLQVLLKKTGAEQSTCLKLAQMQDVCEVFEQKLLPFFSLFCFQVYIIEIKC